MEKDLVIGFITGYKFDKLKPWIYSLNESGFKGDKVLICYDIEDCVMEQITNEGIIAVKIKPEENFNIVVNRFYHLWYVLKTIEMKYRYVITTDVADVIFQSNPSDWLEENLDSKYSIISSGEGLKYKNEPWGINNINLSFGQAIMENVQDNIIRNAGVIAGTQKSLKDLAINVFLSCRGSPLFVPGGGGPDQAAYNFLLSLDAYSNIEKYTDHSEGWACQCGTVADPNKIDSFRSNIVDCEPKWDGEYAYTPSGKKYVIVHQYNRVPSWKQVIEKRYDR